MLVFSFSILTVCLVGWAELKLSCLDKSNYTAMHDFFKKLNEQYPEEQGTIDYTTTKNEFNCEYIPPSDPTPTSVHALKPGDINIVAALGDSLSAGNGAGAHIVAEVYFQYRGLVFSIGGSYLGDNTVEEQFTLPNAIKKYNPDVKGWAKGIAKQGESSLTGNSRLDEAKPGAKSPAMVKQAQMLIDDLIANEDYNYEEDWKMVTIFIGGNNLCQYCVNYDANTPEQYCADIERALDLLHSTVPRMIVNLLTIFNIDQIVSLNNDKATCKAAHTCFCYCPLREEYVYLEELQQVNDRYRDCLWDLVDSGKYDTRDDFTVVIQPFFEETLVPRTEDGKQDLSYFAPDCFHFSKKGHNAAGQALWNNLFQPLNGKSRDWALGEPTVCPTPEKPYIYTSKNSQ